MDWHSVLQNHRRAAIAALKQVEAEAGSHDRRCGARVSSECGGDLCKQGFLFPSSEDGRRTRKDYTGFHSPKAEGLLTESNRGHLASQTLDLYCRNGAHCCFAVLRPNAAAIAPTLVIAVTPVCSVDLGQGLKSAIAPSAPVIILCPESSISVVACILSRWIEG